MVEHNLAKVGVASSNLVSRSIYIPQMRFLQKFHLRYFALSPDGEIGRRKGLKIPRWQHCAGSSPAPGTIQVSKTRYFNIIGQMAELVECTGLENRRGSYLPGFESLSVRHFKYNRSHRQVGKARDCKSPTPSSSLGGTSI